MITLFHRPALASSNRVYTLLKQISAEAAETATEDQASDHTRHNKVQRSQFELNITEEPPTTDQLRSILEYVGAWRSREVVEGAGDELDAVKRFKQDPRNFKPPIVSSETRWQLENVLTVEGRRLIGITVELVSDIWHEGILALPSNRIDSGR